MNRQEKYINYIVNDLMKNTYQSDTDMIHTPVRYEGDGQNYYIHEPFQEDIVYLFNESTNFQPDLYLLLKEHYGVRETEYDIISNKYKESLLEKYPY
jgi:hypothetical protein